MFGYTGALFQGRRLLLNDIANLTVNGNRKAMTTAVELRRLVRNGRFAFGKGKERIKSVRHSTGKEF